VNPDPTICPLCGKNNRCGMAQSSGNDQPCWCMSGEFSFPDSLLNEVTDAAKNKACICRECASRHHELKTDASRVK